MSIHQYLFTSVVAACKLLQQQHKPDTDTNRSDRGNELSINLAVCALISYTVQKLILRVSVGLQRVHGLPDTPVSASQQCTVARRSFRIADAS